MKQQEFDVKAFRAIVKAAHKEHGTAEAAAEQALRRAILMGVFAPGFHMTQTMLAEHLASSRGPIQNALHTLAGERLVDINPNRGATVRKLTIKDIKQNYRVRICLGKLLIGDAAELATAEDLDELEEIARQINQLEDEDARYQMKDHFYQRLYEIADQPMTSLVVNDLRADQGRYWLSLHRSPHVHQTHAELVQALREGDTARAEQWLEEHLTAVCAELETLLLRKYAEDDEN